MSVVVPAYNAEKYLSLAVGSVLDNDVSEMEVVICVDGANDRTEEIALDWSRKDSRVQCFNQRNAGASAARNAAFEKSEGRWILYCDADDYLQPHSLDSMLQIAQEHPDDVVFCQWAKFLDEPGQRSMGDAPPPSGIAGWEWVSSAFRRNYPTYPGTILLPRRTVERLGGWNESLSFQDDMEFYARMICASQHVRFCSDALFCYRDNVAGSLSHRGGRRSAESQLMATRLATDHLLQAHDDEETRKSAIRQLMLVSFAQYLTAPDISADAEAAAKKLSANATGLPWLPGGRIRRVLQLFLGWKAAIKVHALLGRLRATVRAA